MLDPGATIPVLRTRCRGLKSLGEDGVHLIHAGPKNQLDPHHQHPARDARRRHGLAQLQWPRLAVPSLVGAICPVEYTAAGGGREPEAGPTHCRWQRSAPAMQEAVPVGAGAMAPILGLDAGGAVRLVAPRLLPRRARLLRPSTTTIPKQTVIAGTKAGGREGGRDPEGCRRQAGCRWVSAPSIPA